MLNQMIAKYFKILLLFIFVTVPALDIAFLDNQESTDHFSEAFHGTVEHDEDAAKDLHCICHVIHHGVSVGKAAALTISNIHFKSRKITTIAVLGLNPKPGLHPPSSTLT